MKVKTLAEYSQEGKKPEILFWVGCAGSLDPRAQKITLALIKIMQNANVSFGVLGNEESCTGDPARRAGNEFLFQMSALQNIEVLNMYGVTDIVTACPHCFNTLKNEYPALGGNYNVIHHTQLLQSLIDQGKLTVEGGVFKGQQITYHDSCYLGRVNGIYEAPRSVLSQLDSQFVELKRNKSNGFCCGAGGAQVFKEEEKGLKKINHERVDEIIETGSGAVAANCPYCILMLSDGIKANDKEDDIRIYDISELIVESNKW